MALQVELTPLFLLSFSKERGTGGELGCRHTDHDEGNAEDLFHDATGFAGGSSLGMGLGSFFGRKIFPEDIQTRLKVISFGIVVGGFPLAAGYPLILNNLMGTGITVRAMLSVLMILPFGFLLGIPFPTAIQLLKQNDMEQFIPWMYGVNAMMSVLGSVTAIILSMQLGFTFAFAIGLFFYMMVFLSAAANTPRRF